MLIGSSALPWFSLFICLVGPFLRVSVRKGEGAKIWFYKPEWEKGCDMKGGTFQALKAAFLKASNPVETPRGLHRTWQAEGFKVPHMKKGMLTMDRHETQAQHGTTFENMLKCRVPLSL